MFIKLTRTLNNNPLYVNVFDISVFYAADVVTKQFSYVCTTGYNAGFKVDETPEEIMALIEGVKL